MTDKQPHHLIPTRISWSVHGYCVGLDEDGVHLDPGKHPLEQSDLLDLLQVINTALEAAASDNPLIPTPPTAEDLSVMRFESARRYHAKQASEAILGGTSPARHSGDVAF